jgi:uncharacterized DUF497 family protein
MKIGGLYWKGHIIEKIIGDHGVTREEVEEVILEGSPEVRKTTKSKTGNDRYLFFGQSRGGRYLKIVLELESKGIYVPITALDMSDAEKQTFRKRRK